jgi:hypothetical protein
MGQYYKIVNLDKKQYIRPRAFDDGAKLLEFGMSGGGTMCALALLLASGNGRGGGDHKSCSPAIGSWAGDRIVVAGDYADKGAFTDDPKINLYHLASDAYEDISSEVAPLVAEERRR